MDNNRRESQRPTQQPILMIGEYGVLNGGERSFLTVAKQLIAHGWSYIAAVPIDSPFETALQKIGIRNVGLTTHAVDGTRFSQIELRHQIADLVADVQPCLLHANSLSMSRLVGPLEVGTLSVGYLRDIMKLSKKAIADINQNDLIVAVSNGTAQWHVTHGLDAGRVVTIYNGVDSEVFRPLAGDGELTIDDDKKEASAVKRLRREFGFSTGDCVLLYVGQIGMRKGINDLAEIFLQVALQVSGLKLLIVGERHSTKAEAILYEQNIHERLSESPFGSAVQWLGRREDVADLMRLADILLHPARQEPLGRVLLEACASSLPIVTTNVGGSPEILNGALLEANLFAVGDNEQAARRIVQLCSDKNLHRQIGLEQRKHARQRFSIAQAADSLERAYLSVLSQPSHSDG